MEGLLKIIHEKSNRENEHALILAKIDASVDALLISGQEHSSELDVLEQAELAAAKSLKTAEDALIQYHPISAQEYGVQTSAIMSIISKNENNFYVQAVKRGAKALASGGLK